MKKMCALILAILTIILGLTSGFTAFADTITVTFMNENSVFYTVETDEDGNFSTPKDSPELEGYVFKGWCYVERDANGNPISFPIVYEADKTYNTTKSIVAYAMYEEKVTEKPYARIPAWEIAVISVVGIIILALIAFVYYWCVIKKRSIKEIFIKKN